MPRIVAFTLNPSIDISTSVEHVQPGRKLRCAHPLTYPGGGGVNVARVAARLGADVELIYPTGGATGQLLRRLVDRESIPNLAIELAEETREDFTVMEETTGNEYRFVFPGPRFSEKEWRSCLQTLTALQSPPSYIVASGSLPPDVPADFFARAARIAKDLKCRFVLDTSGEALAAALAEGVYMVKPNLRELRELVGEVDDEVESIAAAARELIDRNQCEVVAISLGELGAILVTRSGDWCADAPPVKAVSTVGAGDSFLGALVWGLDAGLPVEQAFRHGVAAGAAAVLTPGTALSNPADIDRLLPAIQIRPISIAGPKRIAKK